MRSSYVSGRYVKVNPKSKNDNDLSAIDSPASGIVLATIATELSHLRDVVASISSDVKALCAFKEEPASVSPPRTSFGTAEVAVMVKRSEFQVRKWCRENRILADKKDCGRGRHGEWLISADEVARVLNEGLLPLKEQSRAAK